MRAGDLSVNAAKSLDNATKIYVSSSKFLNDDLKKYDIEPLDEIYLSSRNFDTLNKKLASTILAAAKSEDIVYLVDGSVTENVSCGIILSKHKDCTVFDGVSKSAYAKAKAALATENYCSVSAYWVDGLKSCSAAVVYDIDCELVAGLVKQRLSLLFGEESDATFVSGDKVKKIKVYEIDRQNFDEVASVVVSEKEFLKKERYDYADLEEMIRLLRKPNGCPWDRVQTSESIKSNMIEEAYELVDAIERDDGDGMEEETGDVLLQAAFHSVINSETGIFSGSDAITRVVKKLIFRHSHIFGKDKAKDEGEALGVWDKNKAAEKHMSTYSESVLAVPKNLPSCMYAQKVQKRAAKSGMDFMSSISAAESLNDELSEFLEAVIEGEKDRVFEEAGDLLFSAINTCRLADVDCEDALRQAVKKFTRRFCESEKMVIADGKNMTDLNELELNYYWVKAKNALKENKNRE